MYIKYNVKCITVKQYFKTYKKIWIFDIPAIQFLMWMVLCSRSEKHSTSGSKTMEAEKRIRREIANSNERRRMQSINAGFQALRTLLPRHEGEKLSKVSSCWIHEFFMKQIKQCIIYVKIVLCQFINYFWQNVVFYMYNGCF